MKPKSRVLFLFVCFTFIFFHIKAQKQQIDSLRNSLNSSPSDTIQIKLMNELTYLYAQTQPDSALYFGQKSLKKSEEIGYAKGKAWTINYLSWTHLMRANYPEALRLAFRALDLFEGLKDSLGIAKSYSNIANAYHMQDEYILAIQFYEKAKPIFEKQADFKNLIKVYANLGRAFYKKQQYDEALIYLDKAIVMQKQYSDKMALSATWNTLGDVYQAKGEYERALSFYIEAFELAKTLQIARIITYSTRGMSEVYQIQNQIEKSNQYALQTLKIAKDIGYLENVKNAAFILSENYKKLNDFESSLNYLTQYNKAKDKIFNEQKAREIANLKENYQLSQKEKEIALLEASKKLQEEKNYNQDTLLSYLVSVIALLVIFIILLYRNQVIKKQTDNLVKEKEIIEKQKQNILSKAKSLEHSDTFKDKIFSIISHDLRSPFNSLLAITEYLDEGLLSASELKNVKKKIQQDVRGLSEMLNSLLLWSRQQMEGKKINKQKFLVRKLVCEASNIFEIPAAEKNISLSCTYDSENQLYVYADYDQVDGVVRNLVNNAIKFTEVGGTVKVSVQAQNGQVLVKVADSGVGISEKQINKIFDKNEIISTRGTTNEKGTGLGLFICKDFIELNEGQIGFTSIEGQGSTFYFTLPLVNTSKAKQKNLVTV